MACVDHIESRRQWVPLTAQPFQMIAAGMALGWVVAMASWGAVIVADHVFHAESQIELR